MPTWKDQIRDAGCEKCPLHVDAEWVCLMGAGTRDAKIAIIGEAPGQREDEEHRAFVGSAGKLLRSALRQVGIDPRECYITNTAKCRPPGNRTPKRSEIKTCVTNYLVPELEQVKPDYIMLLGNVALLGVIGKSGIMKQAGTVFEAEVADDHWAKIMPIIHPAAVLRNPKWSQLFSADMLRFSNLIRGIDTTPQTKIKLVTKTAHLAYLRGVLEEADEISWDVETDVEPREGYKRGVGQDWHGDESYITSIAFSTQTGESFAVPISHIRSPWRHPEDVLHYLAPALLRPDVKLIAQNGKFDARWLHSKGIPVRQTFDTMLAAHMLEENRPKGLKSLAKTQLGAAPYDLGEEVKNSRHTPLRPLLRYNALDADYTLRLYHIFRDQLKEEPRVARIFMKLMMPASEALVDIERYGVYIDWEKWEERRVQCEMNRDKVQKYINQFWPEDQPINLNAPMQVGRLLYDYLELPILGMTKSGDNPSTAETHLLRLAEEHKVAKAIMIWRKWNGYITRYLDPWKYEWSDSQGRIHASYKLFGTVTGRLSGEGGIQQVPRDPLIRSIVGAQPGWSFVQGDYSQVELRIAAWLAGEERMLRQYLSGEDVHMIRALKMTQKVDPATVTKEERKRAKPVSFGYVYGMGAKKFVTYAFDNYGVKLTYDEAKHDRDGFFEDYPTLLDWHERQRSLARRYHRVNSPLGRIRHLPDILSADDGVRGESERQAINSPVQSFASDLMLISLLELHRDFNPTEARVIGTVHDSILFEVRDDKVDEYVPFIKETMEDMSIVRKKFGTEVEVPIVADLEVGTHWGEGKPWQE